MAEETIVVFEDFEDNSFNFKFDSSGIDDDYPFWFRTSINDLSQSHSGQGVFRNGNTSIVEPDSVLYFEYFVPAEDNSIIEFMFKNLITTANNYFYVSINGNRVLEINGTTKSEEWKKYRSESLKSGENIIYFIFKNMAKIDNPNDIIYIDDIKIVKSNDKKERNTIIKEDFSDDLLNFNITGNQYKWIRSVRPDGKNVLRSYPIKDNENSECIIELDIPEKATDILFKFKYMLSTESGYDIFTMRTDNRINFNGYSGNIAWSTYQDLSLTTGKHKVSLLYTKDYSTYNGEDAVFITDIELSYNLPNANPVPKVVYIETDKSKISDEIGMNQSIITVRFDTDVKEYVARLNGSDATTGVLVHSGSEVKANTDAEVIVDWNELDTEGENRINVYGLNDYGWTEYKP